MYFDNSVFDFYVGLFSGASLTPVSRELDDQTLRTSPYVGTMGCTVWFSVPSLLIYLMAMKAMTPVRFQSLRAIVFGGEGYPKVELQKLYDAVFRTGESRQRLRSDRMHVHLQCLHACGRGFPDLAGLPTLGRLNPELRLPHPRRGGPGCLGQWRTLPDRPQRGRRVFQRSGAHGGGVSYHHRSNRFMKRMYRTGDLVREEAGELHFIGRKDNQIKHMGYRIELEEIEHALVKLSQVNQAAVVYQRNKAAYGKLVGFVACSSQAEGKDLLMALSKFLPDYMIPGNLLLLCRSCQRTRMAK